MWSDNFLNIWRETFAWFSENQCSFNVEGVGRADSTIPAEANGSCTLWYEPGQWAKHLSYISMFECLKKTAFRCYSHFTNKDLFSSSHNLKMEELGFNSRFSDPKVHLLFTEQLVDTAVSILSAFHWNHGSAPAMKVRLCTPGQLGLLWDQKTSFCAHVGGMPSLPLSHVARAPPENRALVSVSPSSFSRVQAGTRDKSFCLLPLPTSPPDLHDIAEISRSVYWKCDLKWGYMKNDMVHVNIVF